MIALCTTSGGQVTLFIPHTKAASQGLVACAEAMANYELEHSERFVLSGDERKKVEKFKEVLANANSKI